ncbi:MAG: glycosyltransferase [Lachnospiraceae bacterium]|nr:glycosyltransferase [Lachnospiraceae bacterium]
MSGVDVRKTNKRWGVPVWEDEGDSMKDKPLISIIVPVYNVEEYLSRCVDSIINQTYTNLEIILIDDGATDGCGVICDSYAEKDDRIKVIHKENGGLSDARNAGLNIMAGEYVSCIDSDDFVSPYFIENLYNATVNTDCQIVGSWFVEYFDGNSIPEAKRADTKDVQVYNRENLYRKMLYQDGVEVSAWGKLYKSTLFDGVRYPKGKIYEDILTTYKLIEKVDKMAILPNVDYFYYQRANSIAQSKFNIRKLDAVLHMGKLRDFIIENYPSLESPAKCRYFSTVCNILFQIHDSSFEDERKQLWGEVKKYRKDILFDKAGRKKARLAAAISYFGYKIMDFVYSKTQ